MSFRGGRGGGFRGGRGGSRSFTPSGPPDQVIGKKKTRGNFPVPKFMIRSC